MTPSHTQLSRPIPLGCFTPWNPDDGASARGLCETFLYRVQLLKPIACFAQSFFQPTTEMAAIGNPRHPYMEYAIFEIHRGRRADSFNQHWRGPRSGAVEIGNARSKSFRVTQGISKGRRSFVLIGFGQEIRILLKDRPE